MRRKICDETTSTIALDILKQNSRQVGTRLMVQHAIYFNLNTILLELKISFLQMYMYYLQWKFVF